LYLIVAQKYWFVVKMSCLLLHVLWEWVGWVHQEKGVCVRNREKNTRRRNGGMSRQVKKFISRFGGVRNNTFNGIEQEFNSGKNSILLRAPPLFPKRRAAAGHFGITYESLHF
jgi:hypothetical protein